MTETGIKKALRSQPKQGFLRVAPLFSVYLRVLFFPKIKRHPKRKPKRGIYVRAYDAETDHS